jgi:hypothetical protein
MPTLTPMRLTFLFALLVGTCVGCGDGLAKIEGTVTYDGVNVEKGMLTITPADGLGSVVGCNIEAGKFKASGVQPGKNVLLVTAVKDVTFSRNTEDMANLAANQASQGGVAGLIDPADLIPANAEGNSKQYEFVEGTNRVEMVLTKPKPNADR